MEFLIKLKDELMDGLAKKIAVGLLAILGSGMLGFKVARSQDKEDMKREVKEAVLQEIKPALDSAASKTAQIFFLMDQVVTTDQKARAAANFQQAKANLGIK